MHGWSLHINKRGGGQLIVDNCDDELETRKPKQINKRTSVLPTPRIICKITDLKISFCTLWAIFCFRQILEKERNTVQKGKVVLNKSLITNTFHKRKWRAVWIE